MELWFLKKEEVKLFLIRILDWWSCVYIVVNNMHIHEFACPTHNNSHIFFEVLVTNRSKKILLYKDLTQSQESRKPNPLDLLACQWKIDEFCLLSSELRSKHPWRDKKKRISNLQIRPVALAPGAFVFLALVSGRGVCLSGYKVFPTQC